MKALAAGIIICLINLVSADIEDDYRKEGIIPDVLDRAPKSLLQVSYKNKNMQFGEELIPIDVKDAPEVELNFDASKFHTLTMNDPDAPSRQKPKLREFLHWVIVNIPGNDLAKGDNPVAYLGAGPPQKTGLHRYIFNLYQQPDKITFDEKFMDGTMKGRINFSSRNFSAKYNLGDPIAGNMFQAQYVP